MAQKCSPPDTRVIHIDDGARLDAINCLTSNVIQCHNAFETKNYFFVDYDSLSCSLKEIHNKKLTNILIENTNCLE